MSEKILLDTDIGSDIDDAVCLAYLLANPDCDLLGITTVSGEVEKRAQMASVLCKIAGKQIPIFLGSENPLLIPHREPEARLAPALPKWAHDTQFPKAEAVTFMRDTIRQHPGEITLLAIGAMTNVALLFKLDPEIPRLLNRLVLMCGMFTNRIAGVGPNEWNALVDPHATAIVYQSTVGVHRSVGLDVTCQVRMNKNEVLENFQAPLLQPVLDFAEVWFTENDVITFHDPLAATMIFDDAICQFERGLVEVELTSERLAGVTHWTPQPSGPHEVAVEVDPGRFFDHYFSVF